MNDLELRTMLHHYTKDGDLAGAPEGYADAVATLQGLGFLDEQLTATPAAVEFVGKLKDVRYADIPSRPNVVFMELLLHHANTTSSYSYSSNSIRTAMSALIAAGLIDEDRVITGSGREYLQRLCEVDTTPSWSLDGKRP